MSDTVSVPRRPSWPQTLAGLALLVPVGWTMWLAGRFAWDSWSNGLTVGGVLGSVYFLAGLALVVYRCVGLWRERWAPFNPS